MKDEDYKPFYLNDLVEINDGYYILNGWPQSYPDEDLYYEIHIESNSPLKIIKYYVEGWIYVDLISSNKLEIYYGEFISESFSDGILNYTNYRFMRLEKTSKTEWKPKLKELEAQFDAIIAQRLPTYIATRTKVANNFKRFYKEIFIDSGKIDEVNAHLFGTLYSFPRPDLFSEADLHSLVNPNKKLILFKDWGDDYRHLEAKYSNLVNVDLNDYHIIKLHVIDIYKSTFNYMLPNLKYQFSNVNEQHYTAYFDSIIEMLDKTDA